MNDGKLPYKDRLIEVIGPLRERLFEIERCDIAQFIASPNGRYYISMITSVCFNIPNSKSTVDDTIMDVESVQNRLTEIFKSVKVQFDARDISPFEDTEKQIQRNEEEFRALCADITSELQHYKVSLEQLSEKLNKYEGEEAIPDSNKLQFNLTVEELGVFMRLLKETNIIIPEEITNRAIAEWIINQLISKRGGAKRINKLEDCLSSNDLKTWETIRDIVAEMAKFCHFKLKEIKS